MTLPNFICVGPGRAGTSWLYEVLLEHPQVCMAKNIKETQYFNENYDEGFEWYKLFFKDCGKSPAVGEISNDYIFSPGVGHRIRSLIPDCKIIINLRNPYDRIQSEYSFNRRNGKLNCTFKEALIRMPEYFIQRTRYYSLIRPYYDLFGGENIFLAIFEDITERPHVLCRELFRFLKVNEDFVPSVINKRVNPALVPRYQLAAPMTKGAAKLMRKLHLYRPLTWAKRQDWLKELMFREYDYKKENLITPELKAMIDTVALPELERLEKLIGKLPETWK